MKPRHKRFALIIMGLCMLSIATALILNAFRSNLVFFYSPSQVANRESPQGKAFRLGGLVLANSLKRQSDGLTVSFSVTDTAKIIPVQYKGILPDLFREGKGVVTQGHLNADGVFVASEVLAKHDENYMPPEAADALRKAQEINQRSTKTLQLTTTVSKP
jgi:cytochrome c-type biogenesis protein CcmE